MTYGELIKTLQKIIEEIPEVEDETVIFFDNLNQTDFIFITEVHIHSGNEVVLEYSEPGFTCDEQ